jgi:hypothetical protein
LDHGGPSQAQRSSPQAIGKTAENELSGPLDDKTTLNAHARARNKSQRLIYFNLFTEKRSNGPKVFKSALLLAG